MVGGFFFTSFPGKGMMSEHKLYTIFEMAQKQFDRAAGLMDLDPILRRLLRKQPTQRYHSAWELQRELKQFVM